MATTCGKKARKHGGNKAQIKRAYGKKRQHTTKTFGKIYPKELLSYYQKPKAE